MKRYGRTVTTLPSATRHAYEARNSDTAGADYAGNCTAPVCVPLTGVQSLRLSRIRQWRAGVADYADGYGHIGAFNEPAIRHVDIYARCRKCPDCLKARAFHWNERAFTECARSNRTWFATLTLTPQMQFHCLAIARKHTAGRGNDMNMESDEAFKELVKPLTRELQKFMKRLRKKASGLRYLATIEKHKSGLPHVHMLIHETKDAISHRQLSSAWTWGFSKFKLVPEDHQRKHTRYVTKYLTKSLITRVAASRGYGK